MKLRRRHSLLETDQTVDIYLINGSFVKGTKPLVFNFGISVIKTDGDEIFFPWSMVDRVTALKS